MILVPLMVFGADVRSARSTRSGAMQGSPGSLGWPRRMTARRYSGECIPVRSQRPVRYRQARLRL